jgi:UDP-N-acetylglucosamine 2-epimerase (non-hydrolysing)
LKISIIIGTRPEIIKMAPVIRALEKQEVDFFVLHTGQHYSQNLDSVFFQELELSQPRYNLGVGSGTHAEATARMLIGIEKVLLEEKPDWVLVEGDTNSVLAGALAAAKLHIKVGHVEAGLRSYDRTMPEELNRIMTDHISDFLFAPAETAARNLYNEGIPREKVRVTGNTIVDSVYQHIEIARRKSSILNYLGLKEKGYFLVTAHREENVDHAERLSDILEGLNLVYQRFQMPLIYPVHPRTRRKIGEFGLSVPSGTILIEPAGYLDFLSLESWAALVLTDSGGVQEETCLLHIPCVTLRDNTERPETVEVGSNFLAGSNPGKILNCVERMLVAKREWSNPFGDGHSGDRITAIICDAQKAEAQK